MGKKHFARHKRAKKLWREWYIRYNEGETPREISRAYPKSSGGHYRPDYVRFAIWKYRKEEGL